MEESISLSNSPGISIVIPVYQNVDSLDALLVELQGEFITKVQQSVEIVFVNDGSTDGSWEKLLQIKSEHPNIRLINLSRNFGQLAAIFAGYNEAKYDIICNMSADLQDPVAAVYEMVKVMLAENAPFVIGVRSDRLDGAYRKASSKVAYAFFRMLSARGIPDEGFDIVVARRTELMIALRNVDSNPFFQGMFFWTGFPVSKVRYERRERPYGKSQWSVWRKVKYFIDGILAYSYAPIRLVSVLGIVVSFAGVIYALAIAIQYFTGGAPFPGWTPIVMLILLLSGLNMAIVGLIGEYIWRIYDNTKNRDFYIIKERL